MTAQTVSQAVAKRDDGIVKVMWSHGNHINAVLPDHLSVKSFIGTAAAALYASDVPGKDVTLMKCAQASPDSLVAALMRCAALGHQPGTDEFYLTPRKVKGRLTVQGIEGYRGIVERMYRSGAVASVVVREVCANDEFDYIEGVHDKPVHKVAWFGGGRGDMIGVYAYAVLTTGAVSRVVILSRDDVMAAKAASDAGDSSFSPWNRLDGGKDHPEFTGRSMWWKTAARRLEPWVPTSAEYRREQLRAAATASDLADRAAVFHHMDRPQDVVDAELVDDPQTASPATPAPRAPEPQPSPPAERVAGEAPTPPLPGEDEPDDTDYGTPGTVTGPQLTKLGATFTDLGFTSKEREQRLVAASQIVGRELESSSGLSRNEAGTLIDTLERCDGDRAKLIALLADGEVPSDR